MGSVELGAVIAHTLARMQTAGVVLGAGSRNAPLSMAFHELDERGEITLHVVVDERSGGFRALGLAKASRRLAVIAVTSGSAVANLAPAILEARHAGIPLLAITADRPMEQVGTGSSQTADQIGIFGPSVLEVVRLSSESGDAPAWSAAVQRAAHLALGTRTRAPGPVQLNVEFRPPLVGALPKPAPRMAQISPSTGGGPVELRGRACTVVLAGDADPATGARARLFAESARVPLLAEPTSNARGGECAIAQYRRLLGQPLGDEIRRVIVFGHPTLSRPQTAVLSRDDVELVVVSEQAHWPDPGHRACHVVDDVALAPQDEQWLQRWRAADASYPGTDRWCGQRVADVVLAALGASDNLVLGASSIIRDADCSPIHPSPPTAYANRGQAGIDGTIATAHGIALATGRRTTVLLGDLTAQHDLGSFVRPPTEPRGELRIVVGDDGGGSLFHKLEQGAAAYAHAFERVFGTPQGVDLVAVAQALGWHCVAVTTVEQLQAALDADVPCIIARYPRP